MRLLKNKGKGESYGFFVAGVFVCLSARRIGVVFFNTKARAERIAAIGQFAVLRLGRAEKYSPDADFHSLGLSVGFSHQPFAGMQAPISQGVDVAFRGAESFGTLLF